MNNRSLQTGWSIVLLCLLNGNAIANPIPEQSAEAIAQTALDSGQYEKAALLWDAIFQQNPKSDVAAFNLGLSLHAQQDFNGAIAAYQTAIELNPNHAKALINLGLLWVEIGLADSAIQVFNTVLSLPDNTEQALSHHTIAHYDLAIIYKRLNQTETAISHVSKALAIAPDFEAAQQLRDQLEKNEGS